MESDVHQARQTLRSDFGNTGYGGRFEHAISEDSQTTWALCNKNGPIRQERHAERLVEPLGYEQLDVALDAGFQNDWAGWKRGRRPGDPRGCRASSSIGALTSSTAGLPPSGGGLLLLTHQSKRSK
jgi:hypothetical protein